MLYVVRHAEAGSRSQWTDSDWLRPLSRKGREQARAMLEQFHAARFTRVVSSPYVRCMETVLPVASHHMVAVEPHDALTEGAPLESTLVLLKELSSAGAIVCSHGDVIGNLLEHVAATGVRLSPG